MSVIEKLIDLYNILDVDEKKEFMVIVEWGCVQRHTHQR